jgi:RNA polymerase sigma-70 factor, ECF subfamily
MLVSLAAEGLLMGAFGVFTMDDVETEQRAIEQARAGDGDAFDLLVTRWSRRVASLAWTITGSRDAAEEIAQETFVRAWQTIGRFRDGSPFGPWILRIATNLSIDHLRHSKRFETFDSDLETSRADSPYVRAAASEAATRIGKAINALPEMQRIVAQLFLVEEYDHAEIAAMTGLAPGTVRSHLSLARAKLREALGDQR